LLETLTKQKSNILQLSLFFLISVKPRFFFM